MAWDYPEMLSKVTPGQLIDVVKKYCTGPDAKWNGIAIAPSAKGEGKMPGRMMRGAPKLEKKEPEKSFAKDTLPNGLTLLARGGGTSPVLGVSVLARGRSRLEPQGKEGIADLVQRLLPRGCKEMTVEEVDRRLSSLGARYQCVDNPFIPFDDRYLSKGFTYFRFEVLEEFRNEGLGLLSRIIRNPAFLPEEIEKKKKEQKGIIMRAGFSPRDASKEAFEDLLFGDHSFSQTIYGSVETLSSVTREDLESFYRILYCPRNLIVAASGRGNAEDLLSALKGHFRALEGGKKPEGESAPEAPPAKRDGISKGIKAQGKKAQDYIQVGLLMPGLRDPSAPALRVMNSILSSRLAVQLREKEGLAYSVGSSLSFQPEFGWLRASMGTGKENRERAKKGILEIIEQMKTMPPSEAEMEEAVNGMWGSLLRSRMTRINQAFYLAVNEHLGRGHLSDDTFIESLKSVTREDVVKSAKRYLDTKRMIVLWTE